MVRRANPGLAALLILLLAPAHLFSQTITTVVGNAINDNRPALQTPLVRPRGIVFDNNGNLIIADRGSYVIRRVSTATGVSTVIAGTGSLLDDANPIPATQAALLNPLYAATDSAGNIYFSDSNECRVRKIRTDGTVQNVAGNGFCGYAGDGGSAMLANLAAPTGIAVDRSRNMLYIADFGNQVIRRVNLGNGIIDTYAGNGSQGISGDGGTATNASLFDPYALAVDSAGNLFLSDGGYDNSGNPLFAIREVTIGGIINTVVTRSSAMDFPSSLAVDPQGRLYIADYYNLRVVRATPGGGLTTIAGSSSTVGFPVDNTPAISAYIAQPGGIAFDTAGNLYISEESWNLVQRVDLSTGLIRTIAGTVSNVLDGGPAINAPLSNPTGIAITSAGSYYIADQLHERIRRVDPNGNITTVAGNGFPGPSPDNSLAASSSIWDPFSVFVESNGNLLYAESYSVVRRLNISTGKISTVAGVLQNEGFNGASGPALSIRLDVPYAAVSDSAGNVYISDAGSSCIRKVTPAGNLTTIAGLCTLPGYFGDGGPASQALLNTPTGLAFDRNGDLLIADSGNSIVRRLNPSTGMISLVAGTPQVYAYYGDFGPPAAAALEHPIGLAVDSKTGTIYITDEGASVVRMVQNGFIFTIAGAGWPAFYGDGGPAKFAFLNEPEAAAVDASGNLLILDSFNNRVRKVDLATAPPPTLLVGPTSLTFHATQGGDEPPGQFLDVDSTGALPLSWQYNLSGPPPAGSGTFSGGGWLFLTDFQGGSTPSSPEVFVDPAPNGVPIPAGTYHGQVVVMAAANGSPKTVAITFIIDPPVASSVQLSNSFLYYEAVQGGAAPPAQTFTVTNGGSGTLNWSATAATLREGNWLSLSKTSGSTQAGGAANTVSVTANSAGLALGFYLGLVTVSNQAGGPAGFVIVDLVVTAPAPTILLSSRGFNFTAVQGSNFVPPQSFTVINAGQALMNWQIQTTLSQGSWLLLSRTSGTSDAANQAGSPTVTLNVDPSGLSSGTYGGLLQVKATGARNSPQFATVILRVLPAGSAPVTSVQPAGLVFSANSGGASQSQVISAQTSGGGAVTFAVGTLVQNGAGWLSVSPAGGSLTSSSDQPAIHVQVNPASLATGIYRGSVTFSFSDGTAREAGVVLIVRPMGTTLLSDGEKGVACSPTQQALQSTRVGNNFALPTGFPATLVAVVFDNCGNPVNNSTVSASFTNGDPTLILQNLGGGVYSKDWVPSNTASGNAIQVSLRAVNPIFPEATLQLTGGLAADATNPAVSDGGVVNGASFAASHPVAPGSIISIFGSNMASSGACSGGNCPSSLPLPQNLGGASVKIGGMDAPLFYAGPGQINAQVPFELSGVSSADVVVSSRGIFSATRNVQIDNNEPGIFLIDATRGAVLISNTDNLVQPSGSVPGRNARPANRGEFITVYCSGLGPVNNPPATGTAAGGDPLSRTTTPVSVTIGGAAATNISFAGLSPGFVGLYQVDVQVPSTVAPGSAVAVKITQNGVDSNTATIAID